MNCLRHYGLYVNDIELVEKFYRDVFQMYPICSQEKDSSKLFDELMGVENIQILTSKLITPYGKETGQGDMLELVKIISGVQILLPKKHPIYATGNGHVAFGVDDIFETVLNIKENGGEQQTRIVEMPNGNLCCFCLDPEMNWIELIQRKE